MPDVSQAYSNADQVPYYEIEIQGWTAWGPTRNFEPGTRRYRVEVTYNGRTVSSPGAGLDGYIPASEARKALRMSVRDARYSNPIAQWATAWLGVPFIMGSQPCPQAIDNFEGIDCADLLIAAHNKGHRDRINQGLCQKIDPCKTNAHMLATNDRLTEPGQPGIEGDLIFWDYCHPDETPGTDGVYDHSMICLGGEMAIWASAGWDPESGVDFPSYTKRCVVIGSYQDWRRLIRSTFHVEPGYRLRRFR